MSSEVERLLREMRLEIRKLEDPLPAWPRNAEERRLRDDLLAAAERMRAARNRQRGFVDGVLFSIVCGAIMLAFALLIVALAGPK